MIKQVCSCENVRLLEFNINENEKKCYAAYSNVQSVVSSLPVHGNLKHGQEGSYDAKNVEAIVFILQ